MVMKVVSTKQNSLHFLNETTFSSSNLLRRVARSSGQFIPSSEVSKWEITILMTTYGCLISIVVICLLLWKIYSNRKKRDSDLESSKKMLQMDKIDLYLKIEKKLINYKDYKKDYEICGGIKFSVSNTVLGTGTCGKVKKGWLHNRDNQPLDVAVKYSKYYFKEGTRGAKTYEKKNYEAQKLLYKELLAWISIGHHPCVLPLVGAKTSKRGNIRLLSELCVGGSLDKYLEGKQEKLKAQIGHKTFNDCTRKTDLNNIGMDDSNFNENLEILNILDLVLFAFQIAKGVEHLASVKCVHRDIALRNVLVTGRKTIQICDFGLTRRKGPKECYTLTDQATELPWGLMAPEVREENKFTEKSDVWSFGICLYELFTLKVESFQDSVKRDLGAFLKEGEELSNPKYCHPEVFDLIKKCWKIDPNERPTFSTCVDNLKKYLETHAPKALQRIEEILEEVSLEQSKLGLKIK